MGKMIVQTNSKECDLCCCELYVEKRKEKKVAICQQSTCNQHFRGLVIVHLMIIGHLRIPKRYYRARQGEALPNYSITTQLCPG